jgi:DnaJ family protein A protein 5
MDHQERTIQCHYDVLSVDRNADAATIKKAHRKLALKLHPDKNIGNDSAADKFRLVQQAYECLSDPQERKWYDQHREAILRGWSASGESQGVSILFDVVPYQYAGCYNGYGNDNGGFFAVYAKVFENVRQGEEQGWSSEGNIEEFPLSFLPNNFGDGDSKWEQVSAFYKAWESYSSCLSFAWADQYDTKEAPDRRVRRAMEDENKKARRKARRERNEDILALVHFCKRRDPRVKARQEEIAKEKRQKEVIKKKQSEMKKARAAQARESWKAEQEEAIANFEEEDRIAGRIRLADLDDDYDYGGSKRGRKGKKKNKRQSFSEESDDENGGDESGETGEAQVEEQSNGADINDEASLGDSVDSNTNLVQNEQDEYFSEESESESEPEPDFWRCECCKKDFKSQAQMENHMKSKKHKAAFKKFQAKMQKEEAMEDFIDDLALDP